MKKIATPVNIIYLLWILAFVYLIVGPFWVSDNDFATAGYYIKTLENLDNTDFLKGQGRLEVGFSRQEINTEVGQPIMGFSDRSSLASKGELSPLYARALTVSVGGKAVTIVGADVMLLMGDIIDDILHETGLARDELFFTATHTHSGAGGWFKHPVFELFYGKFSQQYYANLKTALISAIVASRKNLQPARMKYTRVNAGEWLEDRIYKDNPSTNADSYHDVNPYFTGVSFVTDSNPEKVIAILAAYAAHATVIRKDVHRFSSDYPGVVCEELKKLTGADGVLFAAGSVGDARSIYLHEKGANTLGLNLARRLAPAIAATPSSTVTTLASLYMPLFMPKVRMSLLGPHTSVFPLISGLLFENPAYISYLQLGEFVLVGMPADIAGELTKELQDEHQILITSFNGSWKGYVTKADTYMSRDSYSTREMGLSGPQAGEYLMAIAAKIFEKNNHK